MLILGTPKNISDYYMAEDDISFILQQKGFHPMYQDEDIYYFKLNNKLVKALKEMDIEF